MPPTPTPLGPPWAPPTRTGMPSQPPCPMTSSLGEGSADSGAAESQGRHWDGQSWKPQAGRKPEVWPRRNISFGDAVGSESSLLLHWAQPGLHFCPQPLRNRLMTPTAPVSSQSIACSALGVSRR